MDNIDPEILELTRQHMQSGRQITDEKYRSRLPEITAAYRLLQAEKDETPDFKQRVSVDTLKPDWKISVVACNESVNKSLHPVAELSIGDQRVELSVEQLSNLRYTVAMLMHRFHHYV
uniref:rRNA methyltransferase n=1 Tax=Panagrellus redivivus TaxID=6233 RepID=A0A7E4V1U8_PANRE